MTEDIEVLREKLNNLSFKNYVISDDAKTVKEKMESQYEHMNEASPQDSKEELLLKELKVSLNLLMDVLKKTKFDQFLMFTANPARLFILNFLVSVIYGVGFAVGILVVGFLILYANPIYITLFN